MKVFTDIAKQLGLIEASYDTAAQLVWTFSFPTNPVWEELKSRWNFWVTVPPLVTADEIEALNRCIERHDIYFVTSRPRTRGLTVDKQTRLWLNSIGVRADYVLATKTGTKGRLANALDIELALDDYDANLIDLDNAGVKAVCRRWSYNTWTPAVDSLGEFIERWM